MGIARLLVSIGVLLCNSPFTLAHVHATTSPSSAGACPTVLTPSYEAPVVGSGWTAQLIATNLTKPRGIIFDKSGALLVVQQGSGIVRLRFTDHGGTCLVVNETKTIVENSDVCLPDDVERLPQ